MGHKGFALVQLGKNGLNQGQIEALKKIFKTHNIIKLVLLKSYTREREKVKETAEKLLDGLKTEGQFKAHVIGFTITLKKLKSRKTLSKSENGNA